MLDENGNLIGINGRATQPEEKTGTVLRLGIPINTFLAARNNLQSPSVSPGTTTGQPGANTNTAGSSTRVKPPTFTPRPRTAEDLISFGGARADKGDYKGAIALYNQALKLSPKNPDAYFRLGAAYNALKDYPAALKSFDQVISLSPKNSLAYAYRGWVRIYLTDYQGAVADGDKAINLDADPNSRTAAFGYAVRGTAHLGLKDYQQALADIDQVVQRLPNQPEPYNLRGVFRVQMKDYKLAIADYTQALSFYEVSGIGIRFNKEQNQGLKIVEVSDKSPAAQGGVKIGDQILAINGKPTLNITLDDASQLIRGEAGTTVALRIKRQGRSDFDLKLNRALISTDPNAAETYKNRAEARDLLGDKPGAVADWQKAAELYQKQGKTAEAQAILTALRQSQNTPSTSESTTTTNQENPQTIIATANEAIARNRQDANAYLSRAIARYNLGDKQRSLEDLNQVVKLKPQYSLAWYSRGFLLQELGRDDQAIASYSRAIQANNQWGEITLADAYSRRGDIYNERGDYQRAIADYDQLIRLNPKNVAAYALRGLNYQRQGNNQAAIKDFNTAARLDPNNAIAYLARGFSYHTQGDYSGALAAYEKATDIDGKLLPAVNNLGLIKYELQDIDGAIRQFQAAINIDSKSVEPQLALATALYVKGDRDRGVELAKAALRLDNRFANIDFLKKNLWGDRILADVQKLLQNPAIRSLPSRR